MSTTAASIDIDAFRAGLARDGFSGPEDRSLPSAPRGGTHTHPFEVRGLMLDGAFTVTVDGVATTYRAGEVFTMAPGCAHAEEVGPEGARYLVGRKHGA